MKRRVILILSLTILSIVVLVSVYIIRVFNSVELYSITASLEEKKVSKTISFEEGGVLRKDDFRAFYSNSSDRRFYSVIEKNLKGVDSNIYSVAKDFEIEGLISNDCSLVRCIQYRIPFSKIPTVFSKGLIGIEDYRFLDHFGIDIKSIIRAIIYDIKAGAFVQGGSTLTQQIVKNLFFTNEKSLERKIKEAILAIYLELKFDKTTILQTYFNEVFWGGVGGIRFKGLESASRGYFNKGIEDLSSYEASILIAMLKGPYYYHPLKHTQRLKERSDFIFNKLIGLKLYSQKKPWSESDWEKFKKGLEKRVESSYFEAVYLSQKEEVNRQYLYFNTVLNSKRILGKVGMDDFSIKVAFGNSENLDLYYSRFERGVTQSLEKERHQIGSTIKPILYWIYSKFGYTPESVVSVEPITLKLKSGDWTPSESHKLDVSEVSIERALKESLNRPIIRIAKDIGWEKLEGELEDLFNDLKKPLEQYPAQLLGAVELSVVELFGVYQKFIDTDCKASINSNVINILSDPTQTTIKRRVDKYLREQRFFGKTGTTNKGFDNWFVAYDGKIIYVVWAGVDGRRDNKKELSTYGSNTAFLVFQDSLKFLGQRFSVLDCAN